MTGKLVSQVVPSLASQRSHPHGKTGPEVVPSRWQLTTPATSPNGPVTRPNTTFRLPVRVRLCPAGSGVGRMSSPNALPQSGSLLGHIQNLLEPVGLRAVDAFGVDPEENKDAVAGPLCDLGRVADRPKPCGHGGVP